MDKQSPRNTSRLIDANDTALFAERRRRRTVERRLIRLFCETSSSSRAHSFRLRGGDRSQTVADCSRAVVSAPPLGTPLARRTFAFDVLLVRAKEATRIPLHRSVAGPRRVLTMSHRANAAG